MNVKSHMVKQMNQIPVWSLDNYPNSGHFSVWILDGMQNLDILVSGFWTACKIWISVWILYGSDTFGYSKTELVQYLDPHCIGEI